MLFQTSLKRYSELDTIDFVTNPIWFKRYIEIVKRDTNTLNKADKDFKDAFDFFKKRLEIEDVPKALGMMIQALKVLQELKNVDLDCCKDFQPEEGEIKAFIKSIYDGADEEDWQYDDRAFFYHIDSILISHFSIPRLQKAWHYSRIQQNLQSVVLVTSSNNILCYDKDNVILTGRPLKKVDWLQDYEGCASEFRQICCDLPFSSEISFFAKGTGFFIQKDLIASAGHIFGPGSMACYDWRIDTIRFITGVDFPGKIVKEGMVIPKANIFRPLSDQIIKGNCSNKKLYDDYALIGVQPAYPEVTPVLPKIAVGLRSSLPDSLSVYSFGHGLALQKKFTFDANAKNINNRYIFSCKLDMFGGNSGSPVIDAKTHETIGILREGVPDLEEINGCLRPIHYTPNSGKNEIVQRLDRIKFPPVSTPGNNRLPTLTATDIPQNVQEFAPYVYLNKGAGNKYTIFIMTPVLNTNEYLWLNPDTLLTYSNAESAQFYYEIRRMPNLTPGGFSSDTQQIVTPNPEYTVSVIIKNTTKLTSVLGFTERDFVSVTIKDKFALNAPYVYLRKPSADTNIYVPSVITPLLNQIVASDTVTKGTQNYCYSHTYLTSFQSGAQVIVAAPPVINSTGAAYPADSAQGEFVAIVYEPNFQSTGKKKTKKTQNANADNKPFRPGQNKNQR